MTNPRKHSKQIKLWANNSDATVYYASSRNYPEKSDWHKLSVAPDWHPYNRYRVILPEYQEAWEAFLDGEMEFNCGFKNDPDWTVWRHGTPSFDEPPSSYRRKPKDTVEITVMLNGKKVSPSALSEETWNNLRKS